MNQDLSDSKFYLLSTIWQEEPIKHALCKNLWNELKELELNIKLESKKSSYMVQAIYIPYSNVYTVFLELSQVLALLEKQGSIKNLIPQITCHFPYTSFISILG